MKYDKTLHPLQQAQSYGKLQVNVNNQLNNEPVENAVVQIYHMNEASILIEQNTNVSGQTPVIDLPAPPYSFSLEPLEILPYEPYFLRISAPKYMTVEIYGTQIFPEVTAIQPVKLMPSTEAYPVKKIFIGAHTLSGYYAPPVVSGPEEQILETGEPVVIPDHIIIHTSVPSDDLAPNFCTGYKDYIINVLSNEIYPTWPLETIYANVLATLSFTLNRIYTNWYPRQGFNFDVTDTNAFDNKWIYGRNYFKNIGIIVDHIFNYYLSKPGMTQPILTPYCKGAFLLCNNMMEKWISKDLGEQGYKAIQILRYFFGESLYINSTNNILNVRYPWPGVNLASGSTGNDVRILQEYMNRISSIYTEIPVIEPSGVYDRPTAEAVERYQRIFSLPVTGMVDMATWYSIMMFFNKYTNRILEC